jgi:hypothetical protein
MTRFAAILLSRQPLRPNGQTPWVKQVIAAVTWLKNNGYGLVGSSGQQTWELPTVLGAREKMPLRVFVPLADPEEFASECDSLTYQFDLDPDLTEFLPVTDAGNASTPASTMIRRDRLIVKQAHLLIPVSVREDGGMENLITVARAFDREINADFKISHEERTDPLASDFTGHPINPEIQNLKRDFVVHWTRATNGPWPDERLSDFYGDILKSNSWPRTGLETLRRIVSKKRLIASYFHMPAGVATVSFSALPPSEVIPLMKWRARYRRMSFEPYGVGLSCEAAKAAGIRPVTYVDSPVDPETSDERWLKQTKGRVADWRQEKEYRIRGDLSFAGISQDDIVLFCKTPQEAVSLRQEFPYRVMSMFQLGDGAI